MGGISNRNAEHYADPTAYQALVNIEKADRAKAWRFLKRLSNLAELIASKQADKERWESIAQGTTGGGRCVLVEVAPGKHELQAAPKVQASGNPQKMADAIGQAVDLEREIETLKKQYAAIKEEVAATIRLLPPAEYDVLHKLYIQRMTIGEVAVALRRSYSWVTTTQGRAVGHLAELLTDWKG